MADRKSRILSRCRIDGQTGCWLWTGHIDRGGYGALGMWVEGAQKHKTVRAHREAYESFIGPIPSGLFLDHLCRNRRCVNPQHLEPVTLAENIRRGESPSAIAARKVVCKRGHSLVALENVRVRPTGRTCRACDRIRWLNCRNKRLLVAEVGQ